MFGGFGVLCVCFHFGFVVVVVVLNVLAGQTSKSTFQKAAENH